MAAALLLGDSAALAEYETPMFQVVVSFQICINFSLFDHHAQIV